MTWKLGFMCLLIMQTTLIDPCIKGTLNVLSSCTKATSVRRVVLTSSCSCIRYRDDVQQVSPLNESHWSDLEYCKRYNVRSLHPTCLDSKNIIHQWAHSHTNTHKTQGRGGIDTHSVPKYYICSACKTRTQK